MIPEVIDVASKRYQWNSISFYKPLFIQKDRSNTWEFTVRDSDKILVTFIYITDICKVSKDYICFSKLVLNLKQEQWNS